MGRAADKSTWRDGAETALALAHRLLTDEEAERLPVAPFLHELAGVFGAEGAGLLELSPSVRLTRERLAAGEPPLPWERNPAYLSTVSRSRVPPSVTHQGVQFLCAPAGPERFLWLETPGEEWDAHSAAALGVVGQALARRLDLDYAGGVQAEERRFEDAALVARRLAHVYSNVLTSILGFVEMSLGQVPANSTLKRYLEVAFRGAQQGVALTQRLRLLGCKATASATGTPLTPALTRQIGKRAVPGREVEEVLDVPGDLPHVALSAEQLSTVLEALLDNAHEAIEQRGRVLISAHVVSPKPEELGQVWGRMGAGTYVRLDVSDSGPGLGADARLRLFRQPFFTTKPRHHGLGLTIVHSIVSSQLGGMSLADNAGGGLTARVFLPVQTPGPPGFGSERRGEP